MAFFEESLERLSEAIRASSSDASADAGGDSIIYNLHIASRLPDGTLSLPTSTYHGDFANGSMTVGRRLVTVDDDNFAFWQWLLDERQYAGLLCEPSAAFAALLDEFGKVVS